MCRFVESIKLKDGVFYRINLHQQRVNRAFEACFADEDPINVLDVLNQYAAPQQGTFKYRIVYNSDVRLVEFAPYTRREICSLKLVETNMDSYEYKREDRSGFDAAFAQRENCDDVLLVKNGLLTDASYSNIALFDGERWFTPRTPLLYGVNRADLLADGRIAEKDIAVTDLKNYHQIALFNAMIEFGELVLDIDKIR